MHGLASINYDRFSYAIQEGAASTTAFLIPSIIVRYNLEQRVKSLNLWQDRIYWHERKLGIRFDHHDNPDLASIDFTTLSKDLNAANTNLAYVVWTCKSTTRMLDFLDEVARKYRAQATTNGTTDDEAAEVELLLLESQAHMRSWNAGLEDRAEYLSKRGQALVQTVRVVTIIERPLLMSLYRYIVASLNAIQQSVFDWQVPVPVSHSRLKA
jgi:hypothetical protein